MMEKAEFDAIKEKVTTKQTELDKAQGRLDQLLTTLQTKYDVSTIEDAQKKLDSTKIEMDNLSVYISELESKLKESMTTLGL